MLTFTKVKILIDIKSEYILYFKEKIKEGERTLWAHFLSTTSP